MSSNVPKCFVYLQSKGFVHLNSKAEKIKELATFGIIIKSNLKRCINDYNRLIDKFSVFPISGLSSFKSLNSLLHGRQLDKFAVNFDSVDSIEVISEPHENLNLWSSKRPMKNLIILCDKSQSLNLFYSFQNERYRWWRKLSGCPSHFYQSPIGKCKSTNTENVTIDFRSSLIDEKSLCLENVKYLTDSDQINEMFGFQSNQHLIWSKIFPDNATISYMIDGCSQDENGDFKEMWFHESLAPYHVAISIQSSTNSDLDSKLEEVANYLMKEMKDCGITVFPFKHRSNSLQNVSFSWFDSIGIPYSISITQESLQLGIIGLRNKETNLEEKVHITRVKVNLLLYLKLMKPLDVKLAIMESAKSS
ncbi:DNA polymerase subunit gamma-2, mitochondrial-like [Panonychus citri]|uniref:DNA polymerase subunit gamma-2, mitochondrial-like n=1 Tax=Panonychus citri TaxID=50023 RepID=UPI002307D64A|nr:DNA polymerase subunit gamma-2, mitochondrial-like [Panonychus citri]